MPSRLATSAGVGSPFALPTDSTKARTFRPNARIRRIQPSHRSQGLEVPIKSAPQKITPREVRYAGERVLKSMSTFNVFVSLRELTYGHYVSCLILGDS